MRNEGNGNSQYAEGDQGDKEEDEGHRQEDGQHDGGRLVAGVDYALNPSVERIQTRGHTAVWGSRTSPSSSWQYVLSLMPQGQFLQLSTWRSNKKN